MDKHIIEKLILENDFNIASINYIQLIIFILNEIDYRFKYVTYEEKKALVNNILTEFINDGNNIFCKSNNHQLIYNLINLYNKNNINEIINIIIICIDGSNNIKRKKKKRFFCF